MLFREWENAENFSRRAGSRTPRSRRRTRGPQHSHMSWRNISGSCALQSQQCRSHQPRMRALRPCRQFGRLIRCAPPRTAAVLRRPPLLPAERVLDGTSGTGPRVTHSPPLTSMYAAILRTAAAHALTCSVLGWAAGAIRARAIDGEPPESPCTTLTMTSKGEKSCIIRHKTSILVLAAAAGLACGFRNNRRFVGFVSLPVLMR